MWELRAKSGVPTFDVQIEFIDGCDLPSVLEIAEFRRLSLLSERSSAILKVSAISKVSEL